MKRLLYLLLIPFLGLPVSAQDAPANLLPPEKRSANFDDVARHLDLGGSVYAFVDVDGDLSRLMTHVRDLIAIFKDDAPDEVGAMLGNLNFEGILDVLGLGSIQAVGLSSYQEGEVFRNKTFLLLEEGPQGLFRVMGGDPHPFGSWQLAPAGTDLVWEQDLNLKAIEEVVFSILNQVMGPPGVQMAEGVLQQKPDGLDFTWKELIEKLDTRVVAIGRIDPVQRITVPLPGPSLQSVIYEIEEFDEATAVDISAEDVPGLEEPPMEPVAEEEPPVAIARENQPRMIEVPLLDFYLRVENMGWLVDQAAKEFENVQEIEKFSVDGWRGYGFAGQMPPGAQAYKPYLLHEVDTGRLVLVSRPEFMNACVANTGGIQQDVDFQTAVQGLPNQGNGFTYFSPDVVDVAGAVLADLAEGDPDGQKVLPWALGVLGHFKKPQAIVYANQPDGVLVAANQVFSHKGNFFMALVPNPVVLGAMFYTVLLPSSEMASHAHAFGGEPDRVDAATDLKDIGLAYFEYLQETDGAHVPADVAGVHGWAMEIAEKTGYGDASVYRVDGDVALTGHHGEVAGAVGDKSFPGMPFSITLVAGMAADAPAQTTPLAWTRGLQPDGTWSFDSPFYGEGGYILFRDGHVEFFETVEGALVDYQSKEATSDIAKALPPGAKILEYPMPETALEIPEFGVPNISSEDLQLELQDVPVPDLRLPTVEEVSTEPLRLPELDAPRPGTGVPTVPAPEPTPEPTPEPPE